MAELAMKNPLASAGSDPIMDPRELQAILREALEQQRERYEEAVQSLHEDKARGAPQNVTAPRRKALEAQRLQIQRLERWNGPDRSLYILFQHSG